MNANIFSNSWCNMIFEFKNKDYGAYILRKGSDKRHLIAIILASFFFTAAVSTPTILKNLFHKREVIVIKEPRKYKFDNSLKNEKKDKPNIKLIDEKKDELIKTIKFIIPKSDNSILKEDSIFTQKKIITTQGLIGSDTHGGKEPDLDSTILNTKNSIIEPDITYTIDIIEEQPTFPGGEGNMYKFLSSKINYPEVERDNGITGTVYIQFVVGKDGKISDIDLARGISNGLDQEALRVTRQMPAWSPGKMNGRPVKVKFILPITFRLANH